MFICKECFQERSNSGIFWWSIAPTSYGKCEFCDHDRICAAIHHSKIPSKPVEEIMQNQDAVASIDSDLEKQHAESYLRKIVRSNGSETDISQAARLLLKDMSA